MLHGGSCDRVVLHWHVPCQACFLSLFVGIAVVMLLVAVEFLVCVSFLLMAVRDCENVFLAVVCCANEYLRVELALAERVSFYVFVGRGWC